MLKSFFWLTGVTDGAFRNGACKALVLDSLHIIGCSNCRADGVRTAVTCGTMHTAVSTRVFIELAWLLEVERGLALLVARATCWLANPRRSRWIPNLRHVPMTLIAINAFGEVYVALTISLKSGVARITGVAQRTH